MPRRVALPVLILTFVLLHGTVHTIDVLTLTSGNTVEGTFLQFKNGQFEMRATDSEKSTRTPLTQAASLSLGPTVQAEIRQRAGKILDDVTFTGYQKPNCTLTTSTGPMTLSGVQTASIKPTTDMRREMQYVATASSAAEKSAPHDSDFRITTHTGVISVVHFHMHNVVASTRQGGSIENRCATSNGKLAYTRVTLQGWDDPAAKHYQVTSAPQFWFFDRRGELVTKLTERFTYADIDAAFSAARR
ncbi:MAG: hypothetical protein O3B24_11100 [Verrucomicrobia bacterium]|nr:hypothetical protein [Verrucomicrobiota bacterium]